MVNSIPEFPCRDCRVNTVPLEGNREYYEITDELWHKARAIGYGQTDNGPSGYYLCIGCLESRLGRTLTPEDFKNLPANKPSPWHTERLNSRLGSIPSLPRSEAAQYYPNALHPAVRDRFKPTRFGFSPAGAACLGINE